MSPARKAAKRSAPRAGKARTAAKAPAARRKAPAAGKGERAAGAAPFVEPALAARWKAFERYFRKAFPAAATTPPSLHAAMRYAALAPGKRLRPLLVLTSCEAAGGEWERALPAAAAIECVHAFSLVHDDLPAMDDDDFRRGQPSVHKKFGEAMGILAGDGLLALAFEAIAGLEDAGVPPARVTRAVRVLAAASGSRELVGGQVLDVEAEGGRATRDDVLAIHSRKTGGLIAAALQLGGIAAGANDRTIKALGELGRDLGLAFQIHDDLLNRKSSRARLGKSAGTDDARGKATWPRAVGDEQALEDASGLYMKVLDRASALGERSEALCLLVVAMAERQS